MNNLWLIVTQEYLTDIKSKSFWIGTFVFPLCAVIFGVVIGMLAEDSETMMSMTNPVAPDSDDMTGEQIGGMLIGMFLTIFIMIYGAQIFNKVKMEKCNRIVEVLATCVEGRTMMLAKIIAVGLIGVTQLLLWGILIAVIAFGAIIVFSPGIEFLGIFLEPKFWTSLLWGIMFFIGGYIFYGSMFAAVGAMSDKNNENQEYMTTLTFILLGSFYLGEFVVDNATGSLAVWCSFIPLTSPTVGAVRAISGTAPLWENLLSLLSLWIFAGIMLSLAGKIYTSALLLRGKKLTPKDIVTFFKAK